MVKPIPEGYHTVTPMFVFKEAQKAIDFYKKALGAIEKFVMPGPNGKGIMHAELKIGDSNIMLGEENPDYPCKSAETLGESPISLFLYVKDADAAFKKAVDAGATAKMPVQDMFWGDRMGTVQDPFGYSWSFATHTKDLTPDQISKGAKDACTKAAKK
jgi:uncharacterized glyoxalase superfamily protein PhnB